MVILDNTIRNCERNFLVDNLKGFFILFVLLAHTPPILVFNNILLTIKMPIHCIIMPAFFFFSGLLSKNSEKRAQNAIKALIIPYLLFSITSILFKQIRYGGELNLQLFNLFIPQGFMWYLLTLFWMVVWLPHILKIKYIFFVISILSLFSCYLFSNETYHFLAIGIAISMYPIFLAGYYMPLDRFEKWKKKKNLCFTGGLIGIAIIVLLTVLGYIYLRYRPHFYQSDYRGEIIKFICFGCAFLVIMMASSFLPNKKCFLTTLGKNSLLIYVLHEYIYSFSGHLYDIKNDYIDFMIAVLFVIFVAYILSRDIVADLYGKVIRQIYKYTLK